MKKPDKSAPITLLIYFLVLAVVQVTAVSGPLQTLVHILLVIGAAVTGLFVGVYVICTISKRPALPDGSGFPIGTALFLIGGVLGESAWQLLLGDLQVSNLFLGVGLAALVATVLVLNILKYTGLFTLAQE